MLIAHEFDSIMNYGRDETLQTDLNDTYIIHQREDYYDYSFLFSINKVFLLSFEIKLCDKKSTLILCKTNNSEIMYQCALLHLANSTWLQINEQQQITPLAVLFQTF